MRKHAIIRMLLLSASTLCGLAPFSVAQASESAPAPANVGPDSETITVTATRRAVSLQNVPINISAITAENLSNARTDDVRGLGDFTPGLSVADTGPGSVGNIVIRGLSANKAEASGSDYDNSLAIYLGEVPLYSDLKFIDIARVETQLGPQGTLYGQGTLAGAIRYIPNRPDADKWEATMHMRYFGESHSRSAGLDGDATINIPLVKDKIALRSSVGYYDDPGFIDMPYLINQPGVSNPQPGGYVSSSLVNNNGGTSTIPTAAQLAAWGSRSSLGTDAEIAANLHRASDVNYDHTFTTRSQLGIYPAEDLKIYLTWAHQFTSTNGPQSTSGGVLGSGPYENASRYLEPVHRTTNLLSAEVEAQLGHIAQLVSSTAWTKMTTWTRADNTDLLLDLNYGYQNFPQFTSWNTSKSSRTQFNEELRLVSTHGGPLSWVLGGFYNRMNYARDYHEVVPGYPEWAGIDRPDDWEYASISSSDTSEKAVFGEATLKITRKWQLTGGLRWFRYDVQSGGGSTTPLLSGPFGAAPGAVDISTNYGSAGKSGAVWKGNTSYQFSRDAMAYFTVSKGYRLGGANTGAVPCTAAILNGAGQKLCLLSNEQFYGPDTTVNKELGVRFSAFQDKLHATVDVFHIAWDGIQLTSSAVNGAASILVNGGKAVSYGAEMSFVAKPVRHVTINGNYAYDNAHLTEGVTDLIHYGAGGRVFTDAEPGDRLPGSPKNSGAIGLTYDAPAGMNDVSFNWTAVYRGDVLSTVGGRGYGQDMPGYWTHRAYISYKFVKYDFDMRLYADNIFDKYAVTGVDNNLSSRLISDPGVVSRYYAESVLTPRRVGVEFTKKF